MGTTSRPASVPPPAAFQRVEAVYHVRATADAIEARAKAIAVEQSVEMPLEAIDDPAIHEQIVGRIGAIGELSAGLFEVRIGLAAATMPPEPGQIMNMLFGNTSLHEDVALADVVFPNAYLEALGGPRVGLAGIKSKVGAVSRALTAAAIKPQGLSAGALAGLAKAAALGGLDIVKDDHGLANQAYSPFAERVARCAASVREANRATGHKTLYAPSLSGTLDDLRAQLRIMREEGADAAVVAPLLIGLPAFGALAREAQGIVLLAHPAMGGIARIAPPLLLGRLFRLLGADATIFPNYGGRFAYSKEQCRTIAARATEPWGTLAQTAPMPAGGMTLDRVGELLDFYGRDCILLIGGNLLAERERMSQAAAAFARKVAQHGRC